MIGIFHLGSYFHSATPVGGEDGIQQLSAFNFVKSDSSGVTGDQRHETGMSKLLERVGNDPTPPDKIICLTCLLVPPCTALITHTAAAHQQLLHAQPSPAISHSDEKFNWPTAMMIEIFDMGRKSEAFVQSFTRPVRHLLLASLLRANT